MSKKVQLLILACMIFGLNMGFKSNYGLILGDLSHLLQVTPSQMSFIIAIAQLCYGFCQPILGSLALRYSEKSVLIGGLFLSAISLFFLPFLKGFWLAFVFFGLFLGSGAGALSFGLVVGAIRPYLDEKRAVTYAGVINASGGLLSSILSPLLRLGLKKAGFIPVLFSLAIIFVIGLCLTTFLLPREKKTAKHLSAEQKSRTLPTIRLALMHPDFQKISFAFFTCGFHMIIIETHFFSEMIENGITDIQAANSMMLYGIFTMVGSFLSGWLENWLSARQILFGLYLARGVMVVAYLLLPTGLMQVILYAGLLGLTGAATVAPTASAVGQLFSIKTMSLLFGIAFAIHQIGGFLSGWLGGLMFQTYGNYDAIWWLNAVFCILASLAIIRLPKTFGDRLATES